MRTKKQFSQMYSQIILLFDQLQHLQITLLRLQELLQIIHHLFSYQELLLTILRVVSYLLCLHKGLLYFLLNSKFKEQQLLQIIHLPQYSCLLYLIISHYCFKQELQINHYLLLLQLLQDFLRISLQQQYRLIKHQTNHYFKVLFKCSLQIIHLQLEQDLFQINHHHQCFLL